jgi:hypothetical protein
MRYASIKLAQRMLNIFAPKPAKNLFRGRLADTVNGSLSRSATLGKKQVQLSEAICFGAREATIFSKRGSLRNASQSGWSRSSP